MVEIRRTPKELRSIVDTLAAGHPLEQHPESYGDPFDRNVLLEIGRMQVSRNYPSQYRARDARIQGIILGIRYALGEDVSEIELLVRKKAFK